MYVRFKTTKHIEIRGKMKAFRKGDWLDVSEQTARLWIADGTAEQLEYPKDWLKEETGILVKGDMSKAEYQMAPWLKNLEIREGDVDLPWQHTIIWDTTAVFYAHILPCGIYQLQTWQLAVPLYDYDTMACDIGTEGERKATERVIGDLRVPLYDTRLMFIRKDDETIELIERWKEEAGEQKLAFLRALYKICPFILPLPVTWVNPKYDNRWGL